MFGREDQFVRLAAPRCSRKHKERCPGFCAKFCARVFLPVHLVHGALQLSNAILSTLALVRISEKFTRDALSQAAEHEPAGTEVTVREVER